MATITAAPGGGNWSAGATWIGGVVPTSADDARLDSTSGNVAVNAAAFCRSLDCTGYTGTLSGVGTLTIGDAFGGAFKLSAAMTYTHAAVITFVSTSDNGGAGWDITTAGKSLFSVVFDGPGGKWVMQDALTQASNRTITLTAGSLATNDYAVTTGSFISSNSNPRFLTLGTSTVTITGTGTVWNTGTITNLTLSAANSTIVLSGASATLNSGASAFGTVRFTGSGGATLSVVGGVSFVNLERTGTAAKTDSLSILVSGSGVLTVSGTLTLQGNSVINRLMVQSTVPGVLRTLTAANVTAANVDMSDIAGAGAASWDLSAISGGSGDAGGNSGITFTPSVTQTATGTADFTWSTHAWTTRVPLPQDDVVIPNAFVAGRTVIIDMPRAGRNLDMSGVSGNPSLTQSGVTPFFFGSVTLGADMTIAGSNAMSFVGRGSHTFASAGQMFQGTVALVGPGGAYTLQDAFATNGTLFVNDGTLDTTNMNMTVRQLNALSGRTTVLNLGTSTVTMLATIGSSMWNTNAAATTVNGGAATVVVSVASTSSRSFVLRGAAQSVIGTITYTVAGSSGELLLNASGGQAPVVTTLNVGSGRTVKFASGITFNVTDFNVNGTDGNLTSIVSSTPGSQHTLSKTSGTVTSRYVSIQDSNATGGANWLAVDAVNAGNNTGWFFETLPVAGSQASATSTALAGTPQVAAAGQQATTATTATTGTLNVAAVGGHATTTTTAFAGSSVVGLSGARADANDTANGGAVLAAFGGSPASTTTAAFAGTPAIEVGGALAAAADDANAGGVVLALGGAQAATTTSAAAGTVTVVVGGHTASTVDTSPSGAAHVVGFGGAATTTATALVGAPAVVVGGGIGNETNIAFGESGVRVSGQLAIEVDNALAGFVLRPGGCLHATLTADTLTSSAAIARGTLTATIATCEDGAVGDSYRQGQPVTVTLQARSSADTPTDPATLTVAIERPDCTIVTPTIEHTAVGVYSFDIDTPLPGIYKWRAVATGNVDAVAEGRILVAPAISAALV